MAPDSVALLRADVAAHAKSITVIVQDQREMRDLLDELRTSQAVHDRQALTYEELRLERAKAIYARLDGIEARVNAIYRLGWYILATFGGILMTMVAQFAFRGGFFVTP